MYAARGALKYRGECSAIGALSNRFVFISINTLRGSLKRASNDALNDNVVCYAIVVLCKSVCYLQSLC